MQKMNQHKQLKALKLRNEMKRNKTIKDNYDEKLIKVINYIIDKSKIMNYWKIGRKKYVYSYKYQNVVIYSNIDCF